MYLFSGIQRRYMTNTSEYSVFYSCVSDPGGRIRYAPAAKMLDVSASEGLALRM